MRNTRSLFAFVAVCTLCTLCSLPTVASADDEPIVANRLYDLDGRLEMSLTPAMSIFDKYTRHVGTSLGLAYFFHDYIGLEIEGGYHFVHGDLDLLDEIIRVGETRIEGIERLPLTDLKYMTWWATAGFVLDPLYGKINLSAELDFNFHFYLVGGAGVADYKYTKLRWPPECVPYCKVETSVGIKPSFYFGGGLRIHFAQSWSVRVEIRDQFFYDEYDAEIQDAGGTIQDKKITDFVHITLMRLGVCYSFF